MRPVLVSHLRLPTRTSLANAAAELVAIDKLFSRYIDDELVILAAAISGSARSVIGLSSIADAPGPRPTISGPRPSRSRTVPQFVGRGPGAAGRLTGGDNQPIIPKGLPIMIAMIARRVVINSQVMVPVGARIDKGHSWWVWCTQASSVVSQ